MKKRSSPESEIISNSRLKPKELVLKRGNKHMKQQINRRFDCSARLIGAFAVAFTVGITASAAPSDDTLTERNKAIVRDFYTTVLIGRNVDAAPRFVRQDYIQHNPQVPMGSKVSWIRSDSVSPRNCHPTISASY